MHGFVNDWYDEYKYASDERRKEMDIEKEKIQKKNTKKNRWMVTLDDMEVLRKSGIIQAVKKRGDKALIAFQNVDNKKFEKKIKNDEIEKKLKETAIELLGPEKGEKYPWCR